MLIATPRRPPKSIENCPRVLDQAWNKHAPIPLNLKKCVHTRRIEFLGVVWKTTRSSWIPPKSRAGRMAIRETASVRSFLGCRVLRYYPISGRTNLLDRRRKATQGVWEEPDESLRNPKDAHVLRKPVTEPNRTTTSPRLHRRVSLGRGRHTSYKREA